MAAKKLTRSMRQKMIGGVCGGLAEYFEVDISLVRLAFVGIGILSAVFPMTLFYIVAWIVIPAETSAPPTSPPTPGT
jgi:phage shock protein C